MTTVMRDLASGRTYAVALNRLADVEASLLDAEAPGTRDTVKGTLAHLASVEYRYLTMIQAFLRAIETKTPEVLARRLDIAVKAPVTARDGLRQVLTHSSQHRSQVLCWLSAQGVPSPDLD